MRCLWLIQSPSAARSISRDARPSSPVDAAVADIGQGLPSRVQLVVTDLGRRGEVERLATQAVEAMGQIDILLDDAAMFPTMPLAQLTDEIWDQTLQVNLTASLELARALAPGMIERRWGRSFTSRPCRHAWRGRNSWPTQ